MPQLRWWDGLAWTTHTSDARQPQQQAAAARTRFDEPEEPRPETAGASARHATATRTEHGAPALPAGAEETPELGWAGAALTLHAVQRTNVPMLIELHVAGHPDIRIDSRHQAYEWQLDLDWFPERPADVVVSIDLVSLTAPPPFELPGRSLDELLWRIGRAAFPDRLAPWLRAEDGYRLTRWPNWTALAPDTDHIRQTAMLANSVLTVEQLAGVSGRSVEASRTLVNALSLMGVLEPAPAVRVRTEAVELPENSLFHRLRRRFRMS